MFFETQFSASPDTNNHAYGATEQQQPCAWLGHSGDLHAVEISFSTVDAHELHIQNVAGLRRQAAERDNRVPIVQPRRARLLDVEVRRIDKRGVRVVGVNRIDRGVVGAESVGAKEGQIVSLRRV